MPSTAWLSPSSVVSADRDSKSEWSGPSNATASDNNRASNTVATLTYSDWLRATGFSANIPSGATIDGIEVRYECYGQTWGGYTRIRDSSIRLRTSSGQVGDDKAAGSDWPAGDANEAYLTRGATDDDWNAGLTDSDVNSSSFGVDISAENYWSTASIVAYVDHIQIRITYTEASTNSAPTAPTSLECESATNPQNIADTTPEFTAIGNDPDSGDTLTHYEIEVGTSAGDNSMWDSGKTDITDFTQGNRCSEITYAGFTLTPGVTYHWRIKFWDDDDAEGAWSADATFRIKPAESVSETVDTVQSRSDFMAYPAEERSQTVLVAQSKSDSQDYVDAPSQTILTVQYQTDLASYSSEDRSQTILIAQSKTDAATYNAEDQSQTLLLVQAESDVQAFAAQDVSQTLLLVQSEIDEVKYVDGCVQTLLMGLTGDDVQGYVDATSETVLVVQSESDVATYNAEVRNQTLLLAQSATDTATYGPEDRSQILLVMQSETDNVSYLDDCSQMLLLGVTASELQAYADTPSQTVLISQSRTDTASYSAEAWIQTLFLVQSNSDVAAYGAEQPSQTLLLPQSATETFYYAPEQRVQTVLAVQSRTDLLQAADDVAATVLIVQAADDAQTFTAQAATQTLLISQSAAEQFRAPEARTQTLLITQSVETFATYNAEAPTATLEMVLSVYDTQAIIDRGHEQIISIVTTLVSIETGYKVILYNSSFEAVARLTEWEKLYYRKVPSGPGRFEIVTADLDKALEMADGYWVLIRRHGTDVFVGYIDWAVQSWSVDGQGSERVTFQGPSVEQLPARVIKRPSGQDEETHTDYADNAIKAFVRNAWESGSAEAVRVLSGFSVEADDSEYPSSKTLAGEYHEELLEKLMQWGDAYSIDWWVDADIEAGIFVFRTKYPRRGEDLSSSVYFTINRFNVLSLEYTEDSHDKRNVVYVGGPGEGQYQTVTAIYNGTEPAGWNRRETFVAAEDAEHADELDMVGQAYLTAFGSNIKTVRFDYQPTPGCEWGQDFDVGDKVTVYDETFGAEVAARIMAIEVDVPQVEPDLIEDITIAVGRDQATAWERYKQKVGPFSKFDDDSAPADVANPSYTL